MYIHVHCTGFTQHTMCYYSINMITASFFCPFGVGGGASERYSYSNDSQVFMIRLSNPKVIYVDDKVSFMMPKSGNCML